MRAGTFNEAYSRRTAVRRMMNNDDIKGAIIFLASDASTCETLHQPHADTSRTARRLSD